MPAASCQVLGVRIQTQPLQDLISEIGVCASALNPPGSRLLIAHVNITALNLAWEQPWLRDFFNQADRVYCDGMGVRLGARLLRQPLPPRHTLADWVWQLAGRAADDGFSLYLLGNPPGVADRAAAQLLTRFPSLKIAGVQHGYFDKKPGSIANRLMLEKINRAQPGVLLVGMGMPTQERWLADNWGSLNAPVAITCGALFEYLSGDLRRGPPFLTQNYLEWLARIIISPRRYAKRYLRDIPLFLSRVVNER